MTEDRKQRTLIALEGATDLGLISWSGTGSSCYDATFNDGIATVTKSIAERDGPRGGGFIYRLRLMVGATEVLDTAGAEDLFNMIERSFTNAQLDPWLESLERTVEDKS